MKGIKAFLLAACLAAGAGAAQAATTCSLGTVSGMNISNYVEGVASAAQPMERARPAPTGP